MGEGYDLTAEAEAAWTAFRARLADRVAAMADDDVLVVEYADALAAVYGDDVDRDPDGLGAAPYVQLVAFGGGRLRLEAVSDAYLDRALLLTPAQEERLAALGWAAPTDAPGGENFHGFAEAREADRVAVLLVRTLREVWGVPHPAFLLAGGLEPQRRAERDGDVVAERAPEPTGPSGADLVVAIPRGREHLQELVDEALGAVFPDLRHDDDGDIPVRVGSSTAFVRVLADRPAVEVYAEVVVDPVDRDRLALEIALLNHAHPMWQFVAVGDVVVMRHELLAVPFSGLQLRLVVERFVECVDTIAHGLVARVGGRRFHDPEPAEETVDPADEALTGLLELCHLGRPRAATVAGLFGHDRRAIIRQIVRIRTGQRDCDGHDVDDVLHALRRGLRSAADGEPRPGAPSSRPGPRSVQDSLLADDEAGEDTLDLDWPA